MWAPAEVLVDLHGHFEVSTLGAATGRDGCRVHQQVLADTIHHGLVVHPDGQVLLCCPAACVNEGGIGMHIWLAPRHLHPATASFSKEHASMMTSCARNHQAGACTAQASLGPAPVIRAAGQLPLTLLLKACQTTVDDLMTSSYCQSVL